MSGRKWDDVVEVIGEKVGWERWLTFCGASSDP